MKLREYLLGVVAVTFAIVLPSCAPGTTGAGGTVVNPGTPVSLTVSPQIASLAVNGTANFTASTSSTSPATWSLQNALVASVGTLSYPGGANTAEYTAPATPPIYNTNNVTSNIQGTVILVVLAYNSSSTATQVTEVFAITAPSVTAGITPATASVALGGTQYFGGYAVGNINNAVTLAVNGVNSGNATVGTITSAGLYTAPAIMPMSGPTITITCTSVADPTKSASAIVTLH